MTTFIHVTSWAALPSIRAVSLREGAPGRGVALAGREHVVYAIHMATARAVVERAERDGDETEVVLAVLTVDLAGVRGLQCPAGVVDPVPVILVPRPIPYARAQSIERVTVPLPKRSGMVEALAQGPTATDRTVDVARSRGITERVIDLGSLRA
jgi:hypothetical protein